MQKLIEHLTDRQLKIGTVESQFGQFSEELAELIVALNHLRRGRGSAQDVCEEMADVEIMIDEFKHIMKVDHKQFADLKARKLEKWESQIVSKEEVFPPKPQFPHTPITKGLTTSIKPQWDAM